MRRAAVVQGEVSDPAELASIAIATPLSAGIARVEGGRITWLSPSLAPICGRSAGELLGLRLDELFEDAGSGLPDPSNALPIECRTRPAQRRVRLTHHSLGDTAGELWLCEDVTRLRMVEADLLEHVERLREVGEENVALQRRLEEEYADREELLSIVSHELRTPITVISGYGRLLLEEEAGPLTDEQRRYLRDSRDSCKRLDGFVGRLLAAAPNAGGPVSIASQPIGPTVEGVAGFLRPLLLESDVSLEVELSPGVAIFDAHQIEQVVTNLIGNAVKHSKAGGVVTLASRPLSMAGRRWVEISVLDRGPGVARLERERIFQPYVRGSSDTGLSGLGLGLAICRRIVEAHGGSIEVRDREGGGSCFAFTIPAADQAPEASVASEES